MYLSNANQYYRLPGFPGNTYSAPSSSASVYRYASHLGSSSQVGTTSIGVPSQNTVSSFSTADSSNLPLYIYVEENDAVDSAIAALNLENRESVDPEDGDLPINTTVTDSVIQSVLSSSAQDNVLVYQYPVIRCEVDPDTGKVNGTDLVVQRTYKYYNIFNGIRINNSFISFTVDANGISYISNRWKDIAMGPATSQTLSTSGVDINTALNNIAVAGYGSFDSADVNLVYEADEDGYCKLCYEVQSGNEILLVDVSSGNVLE